MSPARACSWMAVPASGRPRCLQPLKRNPPRFDSRSRVPEVVLLHLEYCPWPERPPRHANPCDEEPYPDAWTIADRHQLEIHQMLTDRLPLLIEVPFEVVENADKTDQNADGKNPVRASCVVSFEAPPPCACRQVFGNQDGDCGNRSNCHHRNKKVDVESDDPSDDADTRLFENRAVLLSPSEQKQEDDWKEDHPPGCCRRRH